LRFQVAKQRKQVNKLMPEACHKEYSVPELSYNYHQMWLCCCVQFKISRRSQEWSLTQLTVTKFKVWSSASSSLNASCYSFKHKAKHVASFSSYAYKCSLKASYLSINCSRVTFESFSTSPT
jgi:hypothetical protein